MGLRPARHRWGSLQRYFRPPLSAIWTSIGRYTRPFFGQTTSAPKILAPYAYVTKSCMINEMSALCLLDLSAAFDTVDHDLLMLKLERQFGLRGVVLAWSFVPVRQNISGRLRR